MKKIIVSIFLMAISGCQTRSYEPALSQTQATKTGQAVILCCGIALGSYLPKNCHEYAAYIPSTKSSEPSNKEGKAEPGTPTAPPLFTSNKIVIGNDSNYDTEVLQEQTRPIIVVAVSNKVTSTAQTDLISELTGLAEEHPEVKVYAYDNSANTPIVDATKVPSMALYYRGIKIGFLKERTHPEIMTEIKNYLAGKNNQQTPPPTPRKPKTPSKSKIEDATPQAGVPIKATVSNFKGVRQSTSPVLVKFGRPTDPVNTHLAAIAKALDTLLVYDVDLDAYPPVGTDYQTGAEGPYMLLIQNGKPPMPIKGTDEKSVVAAVTKALQSSSPAIHDHPLEGTDTIFEREVLKSNIPVLVVFTAKWCQACKQLSPIIAELAKQEKGNLKVYTIDIDDKNNNRSLTEYKKVNTIPELQLFNKGKFFGLILERNKTDIDKSIKSQLTKQK